MITIEDIVDLMEKSKNKLLESQAKNFLDLSKIKKTKAGLETLLSFNIAKVRFTTNDNKEKEIVCTSCLPFISAFKIPKAKRKGIKITDVPKEPDSKFKTNKSFLVQTWDLNKNDVTYINLRKKWEIVFPEYVTLSPDTIIPLVEIVEYLLKHDK